ncbi:MAG: glycoside hydrolase family 38 C-terminal domain-containing protein [Candidatus Aminicenantales bacterium]
MGPKITVHLICTAHLDPVWQWRWEEGASEALATFRNAVDILSEHPGLIFCQNEAVLYQWVERYDPALFKSIRSLVRSGRWAISGSWFIQPDVNLPGTESLIRQIAEGRRYFTEKFGAVPRVAYNFDSFGHGGGLPQILRLAGYKMYIHMRPQSHELALPADLYRWRGAAGTEISAYRISIGLYHTERDNIGERLAAGVALALELGRDVPVFWGLGNHGGGATREDLRRIDAFIKRERRVRIVHSTPDAFFDAVREATKTAPVFEGDLQRCFTGCYTSLSQLKRQAVRSLGGLVQSEALAAAAWWLADHEFPAEKLREAWRAHIFNDFHDIITGSCVEPAEQDALGHYGRADDIARGLRLGAVAVLNRGGAKSPPLPVTVANANPSLTRVPVEFECMADYRPFGTGKWHLRLFRPDGRAVTCQEEQPEALLPFNDWRRRISFVDDLPGIGVSRYELRAFEGTAGKEGDKKKKKERGKGNPSAALTHGVRRMTGLVGSLKTLAGLECLAGPLFEPLVIEDIADSWGTECWSYRKIAGRFKPEGRPRVIESGPVRTISRSVHSFRKSRIVMDRYSYPDWPVLEFRLRITWDEERRRLKLRIPTSLAAPSVICEVPGAALRRPSDGDEHVHGRWLLVEGRVKGRPAALGVATGGQHGFDFQDGEVRLSVLRSAAYCHERGFDLNAAGEDTRTRTPDPRPRSWKFMDIGVHEIRLLVTAGDPEKVRAMVPGLADYLAAPPAVYSHLPIGIWDNTRELLTLTPASIRLLACKRSSAGEALIVRLQETAGKRMRVKLSIGVPGFRMHGPTAEEMIVEMAAPPSPRSRRRRKILPRVQIPLAFKPFEIKTVRVEKDGRWSEVRMIEEN